MLYKSIEVQDMKIEEQKIDTYKCPNKYGRKYKNKALDKI